MVTITKYKALTPGEQGLGRHYRVELAYPNSPTYRLILYLNGQYNGLGALWRYEQAVQAGELWEKHGIIPNDSGDYTETFLWGLINSCGCRVRWIDTRRLWCGVRNLWTNP